MGSLQEGDKQEKHTKAHNDTTDPQQSFFFNDTATTEIYTLSLHDALPILALEARFPSELSPPAVAVHDDAEVAGRSEEHTSELQSPCNLVCRLLLEKKNTKPHNELTQPQQALASYTTQHTRQHP